MPHDPDPLTDPAPLLSLFNGAFAGHVRADAVVVERMEPGQLPWLPRATAVILLDPSCPGSRCGIVDLLHPSERGTPRCGQAGCRCTGGIDEIRP